MPRLFLSVAVSRVVLYANILQAIVTGMRQELGDPTAFLLMEPFPSDAITILVRALIILPLPFCQDYSSRTRNDSIYAHARQLCCLIMELLIFWTTSYQ